MVALHGVQHARGGYRFRISERAGGGGHGIAIVPSTTLFSRAGLHAAPLTRNGRAIGGSTAAVWDARRHLPVYAQAFVDALFAYTRRSYPGKEFARVAPSLPPPLAPA